MKKLTALLLAGVMIFSLGACQGEESQGKNQQGTADTQADKGLEVMGDNVKYDPNHQIGRAHV